MSAQRGGSDPVDAIMAVMERAFDPAWGEAWNRRQVSDALVMPGCNFAVIDAAGIMCCGDTADPGDWAQPAGFYLTRTVLGEEELLLIAVTPAARGRGLGTALLRHCIAAASARGAARLFLEMRSGNPAERLYIAHGFTPIGLRRDYYRSAQGTRIDALTFARDVG